MKVSMKKIILFVAVGLVSLSIIAWTYNKSKTFRSVQENIASIPSFNLLLLDSTTVFNTNQIALGRPILFLYFSPDCEHCQVQTKSLLKNIRLLNNMQIYFFSPMPLSELKTFCNIYHLSNYKNIVVAKDLDYAFYRYYNARSFPCIAIYDKQKKLVKLYREEVNANQIATATLFNQP